MAEKKSLAAVVDIFTEQLRFSISSKILPDKIKKLLAANGRRPVNKKSDEEHSKKDHAAATNHKSEEEAKEKARHDQFDRDSYKLNGKKN